MVRKGTRLLESIDVTVATIEELKTPQPTVSNKDSPDVGQKIRYLIDQIEAINAKIQEQVADLFAKDLSVGTSAIPVDTDSKYRVEVTLLADSGNTDIVYVGTATSQPFPLAAGASLSIPRTSLNRIYVRAASGTQTIHIICGGA